MNQSSFQRTSHASEVEKARKQEILKLFKNAPIPDDELLSNLGLFINRKHLTRILWMHELYKRILPVAGVVMELGCRWGQNLALFESFRGMYEPYNYSRKIIGFDTFAGFSSLHEKDQAAGGMSQGAFGATQGYEDYLAKILDYHEQESPIGHIKKYEVIKGDAPLELEKYLQEHPETIIALAYFDMDVYEPTKKCLELIKDRVTKGSIIGFDELGSTDFPGETTALKEVFGLDKYQIIRSPRNSLPSFVVVD